MAHTPECVVCRDVSPPLLQPCRCASHIHETCLRQWVASRSRALLPLTFSPAPPSCEICLSPYLPQHASSSGPSSSCTYAGKRKSGGSYSGSASGSSAAASASSTGFFAAHDPLALQPTGVLCAAIVSLECCLLLCLSVLAVAGHALFAAHLLGFTYFGAGRGSGVSYARERLVLGVLNAALTASILILVRRMVLRWLHERAALESALEAHAATAGGGAGTGRGAGSATGTHGSSSSAAAGVHDEEAGTRVAVAFAPQRSQAAQGMLGHFTLGAVLSLAAGAEVFLLISAL